MTAVTLTRPQKAAAILVAMGKPAAARLLKFFKQDELRTLIESARLLKTIPQSELEKIVAEFEEEFTVGAGQIDSADQMGDILNEALTPEQVSAIMGGERSSGNQPPPVWSELEKVDASRIAAFLAAEHPQTAALVVSKLAPNTAATVLLGFEKRMRSEIIRRMMSISTIPDAAASLIESQIRNRLLGESASKDTAIGQTRVASLLNELDKGQLEEVLQDLQEAGTPNLEALRARLFSFEDIPLLSQKARVMLFDGLSTELVTVCLRNAPPDLTEAVLSSIGARSRRMIEAELAQGSEGFPLAEVIKARKSVAATAIQMAREGAFELPSVQKAA